MTFFGAVAGDKSFYSRITTLTFFLILLCIFRLTFGDSTHLVYLFNIDVSIVKIVKTILWKLSLGSILLDDELYEP